MVLQSADKFPSLFKKNGDIRPLIPSWAQCLIKVCLIALVINIIPLIGGFVTKLVDEANLSLSFVMNTVQSLLLTFALPFARVKLLHLFWSTKDANTDFEEETHIAALAGKQAFARPLTAWLEGVFVLTNGVSLTGFFESGTPSVGYVFGSITAFCTLLHMIGYIGVFLNWLLYRSIADEAVDERKVKK